ncbi:MAG: hypothetical protein MHMPM18_002387 [Marteilia pararefringens]
MADNSLVEILKMLIMSQVNQGSRNLIVNFDADKIDLDSRVIEVFDSNYLTETWDLNKFLYSKYEYYNFQNI